MSDSRVSVFYIIPFVSIIGSLIICKWARMLCDRLTVPEASAEIVDPENHFELQTISVADPGEEIDARRI